ncbi:MAG: hypothetical protein HOI34_10745 [Rhodospirillaceae bacterium]|nr:hypothetical protein [Rhodospirillaceae bacterium]MBT6204164.1 hypothetical protein [Rhodospirillaceae bacterium]MBT6511718.1 hypothetical protein [Rhodospirillaceae bacterium]MBT7615418.1 hypothetical protein [Rhodospirillaceae bacterium]MBT7646538.1 hypothetical protein [Rhodospirillaceae bacterium]
MTRTMGQAGRWANGMALIVFLATGQAVVAQDSEINAVNSLILGAVDACTVQPAQACVDMGWSFAGLAPADGLDASDLSEVRRTLGVWFEATQLILPPRARALVGLGMLLFDGRGPDRLIAGFDNDGDGTVSQTELLADVRLDERPMSVLITDPDAIDRESLALRLELPPGLLQGVFER